MLDARLKKYVIRVGKIVPIFTVVGGDNPAVIAQTAQQPQNPTYAPPQPDPISSWGILASLILSGGTLIFTGAKGFLSNLSKRSEIELKAQELQNQRSENIATTLMAQQSALVEGLIAQQKEDRRQLIELITNTNQAIAKLTNAVEDLKK